eukprot:XP_001696002.1 predicted protein [Chlamydomonas reinhardtii]
MPRRQLRVRVASPEGGGGADSSLLALTRVRSPAPYPVRLVGQLRNGCTAFLAGPCHVVTVAHCVYDPERRIWWPGLEFSAGAATNSSSSLEPLMLTTYHDCDTRGGNSGSPLWAVPAPDGHSFPSFERVDGGRDDWARVDVLR